MCTKPWGRWLGCVCVVLYDSMFFIIFCKPVHTVKMFSSGPAVLMEVSAIRNFRVGCDCFSSKSVSLFIAIIPVWDLTLWKWVGDGDWWIALAMDWRTSPWMWWWWRFGCESWFLLWFIEAICGYKFTSQSRPSFFFKYCHQCRSSPANLVLYGSSGLELCWVASSELWGGSRAQAPGYLFLSWGPCGDTKMVAGRPRVLSTEGLGTSLVSAKCRGVGILFSTIINSHQAWPKQCQFIFIIQFVFRHISWLFNHDAKKRSWLKCACVCRPRIARGALAHISYIRQTLVA